ncbi:fimbrial biogenesis chaperone, partial [Pseudomonas gingeri]|uniref:fimbrial biogenesis chaperone n=2 Tax=Pseudomonas TaxID=286 RepID=UPI00159FBFD4
MQSWIDDGDTDAKPQDAKAPFLLTPPIFRLDEKKGQTIRIIFTGANLPSDRESIFWFNALEIPALPEDKSKNYLQIALRNRLKLFYRPSNLLISLEQAVKKVIWSLD